MLARGKNKGKIPYIELLKSKTPADIEAIRIPSETQGQNNINVYFTSYAPVPPFMLKKIVEYNYSTSQDITASCVKALKAFKHTQVAIATITYAPAIKSPKDQLMAALTNTTGGGEKINKKKAGEQTKAEGRKLHQTGLAVRK